MKHGLALFIFTNLIMMVFLVKFCNAKELKCNKDIITLEEKCTHIV